MVQAMIVRRVLIGAVGVAVVAFGAMSVRHFLPLGRGNASGGDGPVQRRAVAQQRAKDATVPSPTRVSQQKAAATDAEKAHRTMAQRRVLVPRKDRIYFGAFPDFGGTEDHVSAQRIRAFEALAQRKIAWAYFSQNWFNGIRYPKAAIHTIHNAGAVPFVRLMPRSNVEENRTERTFSLQSIIDGVHDKALRQWARDAKADGIPLLMDFAMEMNGDWFPWSGVRNGAGQTMHYGDPKYPDGPERYRDAYRHIIDLFRAEGATNITWFFHPDITSAPAQAWNEPRYYYPGDAYIDWIGVSIYGPLHPKEDYWETFRQMVAQRHTSITAISATKPVAVLEFGVTDHHPLGSKRAWLRDAFETLMHNPYINFKAASYWHENWEEDDNLWATLRVDSSPGVLAMFRAYSAKPIFTADAVFAPVQQGKNAPQKQGDAPQTSADTADKKQKQKRALSWYHPRVGVSWQWQLTGKLNTRYDVALYDIDLAETSAATIAQLHRAGRKVICYFSAGTYEPYRRDARKIPARARGKAVEGWEDERWLDIAHYEQFAAVMRGRLDMAKAKGCDGVEPDNVDGYQNKTGFPLTAAQQLRYNTWLAREAHKRGLAVALKNDIDQVRALEPFFDFAINEECFTYHECDALKAFIAKGKPVLHVEYGLPRKKFCAKARAMRFSSLKMSEDLDGGRKSCAS